MKKTLILVMAAVCLLSMMAGCSAKPSTTETTVPETTIAETTVPETTVPETTVPETTVPEETVGEIVLEGNDYDTVLKQLSIKYKDEIEHCTKVVHKRGEALCYKAGSEEMVECEFPAESVDISSKEDIIKYGYDNPAISFDENGNEIPSTIYKMYILDDDGYYYDARFGTVSTYLDYSVTKDESAFVYEHRTGPDEGDFYGVNGAVVVEHFVNFYNENLHYKYVTDEDGNMIEEGFYKYNESDTTTPQNVYILFQKRADGYTKEVEYISFDSLIMKHYVENDPANQQSREYTWDGNGNEPENIVSFEEIYEDETISGTQEDIKSGNIHFYMPSKDDI